VAERIELHFEAPVDEETAKGRSRRKTLAGRVSRCTGLPKNPTIGTLAKIATALGRSVEVVFS